MPKSKIWKFFAKDEFGRQFATCLLCKKEYRTSGNTSNLRDHLNRFHKSKLGKRTHTKENSGSDSDSDNSGPAEQTTKRKQQKQTKLTGFVQKPSSCYSKKDPKKLELDRLVAFMIANDCQPYSIVEDVGFVNFVTALDPRYELPSRTTISKKILPALYNELTAKLKKIFSSVNHVSITTDMWTSVANQGYITLTAHFVYKNALKTAVLESMQIEGRHTAEAIKDHLQVFP